MLWVLKTWIHIQKSDFGAVFHARFKFPSKHGVGARGEWVFPGDVTNGKQSGRPQGIPSDTMELDIYFNLEGQQPYTFEPADRWIVKDANYDRLSA